MNKKILIGSIIASVMLVLMSFSPSITANVSKPDIDVVEEDVAPTPIVLVLQLISKLRNHKDIENVETEDEILQIIEGDEELNSIVEQLSDEDCGCGEDNPTWERIWPFPVICLLLLPFLAIGMMAYLMAQVEFILVIMGLIGYTFNCWWALV